MFGGSPGAGKTALVMQLVVDALRLIPTLKALVAKVNREDLWREAAKALGVAAIPASSSRGKETFFDGKVFDPADPAAYLSSLGIKRIA